LREAVETPLSRLEHNLIDVAPHPILARLDRLHQGMMIGVIVLARVFILRRIAAAYMPAGQTHSQMNPVIADLQTLFAAIRSRRDIARLINMCACCHK
jgi:hypothetical protein